MTLQAVPDLAPGTRSAGPAAAVATAVRRSFSGSPGRLRVVGAAGILAVLLLTLVGTLAMQARSHALTVAREDAEQLVRVQDLRIALTKAHADATNAYLTGGIEPPALRADYEKNVAAAANLLAEAARANPSDATALGQINDVLVRYAGLIESARANNRQNLQIGTSYLRGATDALRNEALPALTRVVTANSERVDAAYIASRNAAYQFWAVATLALLVLVWLQYWLARRSHRYLNLPIAGLSALLLLVVAVCGLGMAQAQGKAQDVLADQYAQTVALAKARSAGFDAKSDESLTLIERGQGAAFETDFKAVTTEALKALGSSRLAGGESALRSWITVHEEIRSSDDGGDWTAAKNRAIGTGEQDSNATFNAFDQATGKQLTSSAQAVTTALDDASASVGLRSWLLLLVGLLAAAALWWGISERLGEYR